MYLRPGVHSAPPTTQGATIIGSFSLTVGSKEAVKDLKATAEVSAGGGVWSASGSAEFQQQTSACSGGSRLHVFGYISQE